jgi:hypothetical protein
MTLAEVMVEVWRQSLVDGRSEVEIAGERYEVTRTRGQRLRVVWFLYEGQPIEGIEQNPQKTSRWAKLAQQGQRIMQFSTNRRFVANVCEGHLTRYPSWKAQRLPD